MAIKVPVNLATEPFRRDRPIVVGTVALSILLIVALAVQISIIFSERGQAAETRILLDRVTRQLNQVTAQQQKLDLTLNQPANSEVLEKSLFLNLLIHPHLLLKNFYLPPDLPKNALHRLVFYCLPLHKQYCSIDPKKKIAVALRVPIDHEPLFAITLWSDHFADLFRSLDVPVDLILIPEYLVKHEF